MSSKNNKHHGPGHGPNNASNTYKRRWKIIAIALYITFILLSAIPYMADRSIEPNMQESYEYHLRYPRDGRQTHYYVELVNTSRIGKIDLVYTTASNSLDVTTENIKVLHIYCRSMYADECRDVYGIDPTDNSNYYKWYFIEKNHFNVNIDSDYGFKELSFIDTPIPYEVIVNHEKWIEGVDYFYTDNYGTALSHVPSGHTNVDIYFKPRSGVPPTAVLNATKNIVPVNKTIMFDGSGSFDPDGSIVKYIFDFGDGTFRGGAKHTYLYPKPGIYGVVLTVTDNDDLIDHTFVNITVADSSDIPDIQGIVPDQIKPEDSPPWSLNLSIYESIPTTEGIEFYWYLTGENTSLYSVAGENSTKDQLIFTPVPDAFGSDQARLWLHSTENLTVSQPLWINITPVNDPPVISAIPDLILHYDDPYTFNYEPYVSDKDTKISDLILNIFDGFEENYISIYNLNATFNYPQAMVGENIYATVTVSDGENLAQDVINIQVTSDYVPKLVKELPDIWLYEDTIKYNVFDLDDYFTDPDNDAIYFSYGQSHVKISINLDHTVDISAESEWTGSELVTFRARDPIGALAEDSIIVTVLPVNDPPTIIGVPNFIIHYGHDYRFDLTPYVHDNDNTTDELTIIFSDLQHIRLDIRNHMVIIMNYPVEFLGQTRSLRLTVTDCLDFDFQDVNVTITEDFPPELLSPIPDIVFLEDQPLTNAFNLDHYFLDIDGDVLYYTTGNTFINITINPDHFVDFSAPKDWFGEEIVYFRATDPTGALQQDLIRVTVLPVNDAPILHALPPQYGNETERWVLDLEPYIFDVDNNITEMEITVDHDFIIISGTKLIFLGSPELPNEVEVSVNDGEFSSSQMLEIHLNLARAPRRLTIWDLLVNILPFLVLIILILLVISGAVYRKKSKFVAEEVFLIHHGGTLITHLTRNPQGNIDDIIFSGMFTAVQDFIRDTFVQDDKGANSDQWALDELKLGDNNILIERSENTFLAVIFSGEGSKRLRRIVNRLLQKIEDKYADILPKWDGNINQLAGAKEILCVLIKPLEEQDSDKQTLPKQVITTTYDPKSQITNISRPQTPRIMRPLDRSSTVVSTQLTMAKTFKKSKRTYQSKGLLECSAKQMGVKRPGLTPWPLNAQQYKSKIKTDKGVKKLPIALYTPSKRLLPKTIVIKKDELIINGKEVSKIQTGFMDSSKMSRTITITNPQSGKELKIDPSKSLLQQLAEFDD